jgi:hypothetical protein
MQDKLKKYVEEHRDEFDQNTPPEYLWYGVNERLQGSRRDVGWRRLAIAASLFLVVTCGTWIFVASRDNGVSKTTVQAPVIGDEAYYTAMVRVKDAELAKYCGTQPELCSEFKKDLESLNNAYLQLKKEYESTADKKTILQAMTANLQRQLQLTNWQLRIMESAEQKKIQVQRI